MELIYEPQLFHERRIIIKAGNFNLFVHDSYKNMSEKFMNNLIWPFENSELNFFFSLMQNETYLFILHLQTMSKRTFLLLKKLLHKKE